MALSLIQASLSVPTATDASAATLSAGKALPFFGSAPAAANLTMPMSADTAVEIKTTYDSNVFDWGGGQVYMHKAHGGDNQKYYLEKYEDAYLVHNVQEGPGKCLDWDGGNGKPVMWECHKGSNQQWYFEGNVQAASADTAARLKSHVNDNACVDYHPTKKTLYLNPNCHDGKNQLFYFDVPPPAPPPPIAPSPPPLDSTTIPIDLSTATATQSSTYKDGAEGGTADKALAAATDANWAGTCTHTNKDDSPWWKVDLPIAAHKDAGNSSKYNGGFTVTGVSILNRGDCCTERLNGVQITLGKPNNATKSVCKPKSSKSSSAAVAAAAASEVGADSKSKFGWFGSAEGTASAGWNEFDCDGDIKGVTSVTVSLPGKQEYLTICGIKVFTATAGLVMPAPSA
jgi:hypothetical protein